MRRVIFCALSIGIVISPAAPARADYKTSELLHDCTIATLAANGQGAGSMSANLPNILHCLGFIEGSALAMRKTHELYGFAFPNLHKSDLAKEAIAKRYFAAAVLAGLDVCIPDGTTVQALTMLIVNHLNSQPKDLSSSPTMVANIVWGTAYPCDLPP